MRYSIELRCDQDSTTRITALGHSLIEQGISSILLNKGAPPHMSVAVLEEQPPPSLRDMLAAFAKRSASIATRLSAVGTFPGEAGVVFLAPVVTGQLLTFHQRLHEQLADFNIPLLDLYCPGLWVPHCTIATDLPVENVLSAINLAQRTDVFGLIQWTTLSLVDVQTLGELYTFPL